MERQLRVTKFLQTTTDQSSSRFVPQEERIATFDQDGTPWVEHPMYTQVLNCLDRMPVFVEEKPELAKIEPFKTVPAGWSCILAKNNSPSDLPCSIEPTPEAASNAA